MFNIFETVGSAEETIIVTEIIIAIIAVLALIYGIICFLAPIYIYFMHNNIKSMQLEISDLKKQNEEIAYMLIHQIDPKTADTEFNEKTADSKEK